MRIYLPLTIARLREYAAQGAVTDYDEPFVAPGDDEESEYAALMAAAEASAELQPDGGRRVVLVAEVGAEGEPVPMRRILSVHADLPDAAPEDDLAWFAAQEIDTLLS